MTATIWRYSHFALAVSSALFILLATITGAVLAFEPIENKLKPYNFPDARELSIAQVIDTLSTHYDEILEIKADANHFVSVSVISMDESLDGDFYVNPFNGEKVGDIIAKRPLFEFMTNLHRSLFLKTTGRIFVGITSFFLLLIAFTGCILFVQRQKGLRHFFDKIIKEDLFQYYHVVTGRWMLIPVIIVALSGVYLSLLRFSIIPDPDPVLTKSTSNLAAEPVLDFSSFEVFQQTKLGAVRKLEFPFSSDVEDFFILDLKDRQLKINQKTGEVVEERRYPFVNTLSEWSFNVHTGTGSILWSIVLFAAAVNILFFIYSGLAISYKRLRYKVKNKFSAKESEIVILVGSENGSTKGFGKMLQTALLKSGQKVFLGELNQYQPYEKIKNLLILTSTYGDGDPPANATHFLQLLKQHPAPRPTQFSVVGFGSLAYPNFCRFAVAIDTQLRNQKGYLPTENKPFLIHNKSYTSFKTWAENWAERVEIPIDLPPEIQDKNVKQQTFRIINKQRIDDGYTNTFVLLLQSKSSKFQSGDLISITPPTDPVDRLYSIAKINKKNILLSIKRHEFGVCSHYLDTLNVGDTIKGRIRKNPDFHFPDNGKPVILIANGTGIAPFLGMIQEVKSSAQINLYWGGRSTQSLELYKDWIDQAVTNGTLNDYQVAFSKENTSFKYVQDLIQKDGAFVAEQLENGGTIMICGSILMQNGVLAALEEICLQQQGMRLNKYQQKRQILMDCY